MLEILIAGGWAMVPILLCSAVALAIILERFWSLRRANVVPPDLGTQVRSWARTRKLDPEHIEALRANSPLGELLAAALSVRMRSREIIKERIEDTGRHVVHRLRDDDERMSLAEAGRTFVERFEWDRSAQMLETFLGRYQADPVGFGRPRGQSDRSS